VEKIRKNVGGVAVALERAMRLHGGTWICWGDGNLDYRYPEESLNGYRIQRIFLTPREKKGFYDDYANGTLWPLFHYFRERIKHSHNGFQMYYEVNRKFAEHIMESAAHDDMIWLHDYQLAMVPKILREMEYRGKIVFTWHIPWVAGEFYSILPESQQILESLNSCDMVTFHTAGYAKNFRDCVSGILKARVYPVIKSVPLGIDTSMYSSFKGGNEANKPFSDQKMIFSVDRLDYSKGLINRVFAIEELLRRYPELRRKFVYLMVVNPSRTSISEYLNMKRELETAIGRINGLHSDLKWRPIVYIYRKISDSSLIRYYRQADVALITPLIDGLNLVAKEFIAASDHGVLILSSFAGAAKEMDGAIIVNPNDIGEVAESIYQSLNMPEAEIMSRLKKMKGIVNRHNLSWWIRTINMSLRYLNEYSSIGGN
ncbi:MAG: trehalose-6-phosphate synthase, partial [Thermoplasmataceae archaeon]